MDHKEKQVGKIEESLQVLGAKIDALGAKAESAGNNARDDVKNEYQMRIAHLKEMHTAAQVKLHEMKSAGSDKWEGFKVGMDKTWNELDHAFTHLTD